MSLPSHSLLPDLLPLFEWMRAHPLVYWGIELTMLAAVIGLVLLDVWRLHGRSGSMQPTARRPELFFAFALSSAALWMRWPSWINGEQNPDEGQAIATAITLAHDPRFWKSVDAGSHGPLVSLPLLVVRVFGIMIDYSSARLVGFALLLATTWLAYGLARRWFGRLPAKLAVLPILLGASTGIAFDIIAFNGEMQVLLLTFSAAWLLTDAIVAPTTRRARRLFFGAGLIGALVPLAKLQGLPVAGLVFLFGFTVAILRRTADRWRTVPFMGVGGLVTLGALLAYLVATSAVSDFVQGYLRFAVRYADRHGDRELWPIVTGFLDHIRSEPFALGVLIASCALATGLLEPHFRRTVGVKRIGLIALLLLATSFEILRPKNCFAHYLTLLLVPTILLLAALFGAWMDFAKVRVGYGVSILALAMLVIWPLAQKADATQFPIDNTATANGPDIHFYGAKMAPFVTPGKRLVVWGWAAKFYIWSQMVQGVRYGDIWQLNAGLDSDFKQTFLEDFDRAPVDLFLDAVAPGSFAFTDREQHGFEIFSELARRIRRDYTLVGEQSGYRLYARKTQ